MGNLTAYTKALSTLTYFVNTSIIKEIIVKPDTEREEPFRFFYTILFKSNNALDTCSLLLANYSARPHHADSLIIILRSLITDCIIFRYLLVKCEGDEDKLKSHIKSIYFDHIDYTIKGVRKYFKEIYELTDAEIRQKIIEVKEKRSGYYDSTGNPTTKAFGTSARLALNEMAKKRAQGDKLDIQLFYHYYDIYSKYEHPGEFSFMLIHQQYQEELKNKLADGIMESINRLVIPTMISILGAWPDIHRKHQAQLNRLFTTLVNTYSQSVDK
jgi:hypothetical protein